ncbi:MAG: response regulator [Clostridia bacterium]|nr:response regulator [Clostridia bacterium]
MKAICVDDEALVLRLTLSLLKDIPVITEAVGFTDCAGALSFLAKESVDIAILDIDMPDMDGISLAMKIKELRPNVSIIFLTGYAQYAVDAFAFHASGYILKPVGRERLSTEIEYALQGMKRSAPRAHVFARTFGEFDLLVDGRPVTFSRSKAKEVLAYLVDRQGAGVTRSNIFSSIWEDAPYDRSGQKYLDTVIRALKDGLKKYGVEDILEFNKGSLRVCPEKIDCDMYRFFAGDVEYINAYRGEYMSSYPWADFSEAYLDSMKESFYVKP